MSLSPQDYRDSIGIARSEIASMPASILVYRTKLIGEAPSACDGHPVHETVDGMVAFSLTSDGKAGHVYPPEDCYKDGDHIKVSRDLYMKVQKIREDQDRKDMISAQVNEVSGIDGGME